MAAAMPAVGRAEARVAVVTAAAGWEVVAAAEEAAPC